MCVVPYLTEQMCNWSLGLAAKSRCKLEIKCILAQESLTQEQRVGVWREAVVLLAIYQSKARFRDAWTFWLFLLSWTPSSSFKNSLFTGTIGEQ